MIRKSAPVEMLILFGSHARGTMLYFDVRGVARRYDVALGTDGFTWSRDDAQFAQRFRVTIASDGRTMEGEGMMKKDDGEWEPDLRLSYARAAT